jgi:hypothetical protein
MQAPTTAIPFNVERVLIVFSFRGNNRIPMPFIISQDEILLKKVFPTDPLPPESPGRSHPNH